MDNNSDNPAPPAAPASSGILTRRDLARLLNVHPQTVWGWVRDGMPTVQRGHSGYGAPTLFDLPVVRAWLAARRAGVRVYATVPRCKATTTGGKRCGNYAAGPAGYCSIPAHNAERSAHEALTRPYGPDTQRKG